MDASDTNSRSIYNIKGQSHEGPDFAHALVVLGHHPALVRIDGDKLRLGVLLEDLGVDEYLLDHVEPEHHLVVWLAGLHHDLDYFLYYPLLGQRAHVAVRVPQQVGDCRHRVRHQVHVVGCQGRVEGRDQHRELLIKSKLSAFITYRCRRKHCQ